MTAQKDMGETHPARDPPIHGKRAGVNAVALPALAAAEEADGGGAGSLTIAMDDASDLSGEYGSYRLGLSFVARFRVLASSFRSRGINPGSIAVPPTIRVEEMSVFRRSSGTWGPTINRHSRSEENLSDLPSSSNRV